MGSPSACRLPHFFVVVAVAAACAAVLPALTAHAQAPAQIPPPQPPLPDITTKPTATAAAAGSEPLTLAKAIETALRLQPQLVAASENVAAATERVRQAATRYQPTLTPQYSYSSQYNYGQVQRFTTSDNGSSVITTDQGQTNTTRSAELGAAFRLFDTGTRELSARQARQSERGQKFSAANTRQTIIGNVADAYYTALRTAALLKVSEAQVARTQNTLDVVQAQVEAGTSPRKDVYQAQADLANAKVSLLLARNNAAVAQAQLKNSLGLVGGEPLTLADVPPPAPDTKPTAILADEKSTPVQKETTLAGTAATSTEVAPASENQAIDRYADLAYRNRPDLAQARQNIDVNQTSVDLSRVNSRLLVTSDVSAALKIDPTKFNKQDSNNRQINLLFSYPLFDGGFARSQVRANQDLKRASEAQLLSAQQQVAVDVEQSYRNLSQARASLPAAQVAQQAAQINYDAALEARKEGVGSIVEVITAQTTLVQAQINYVQAVYDFYVADARLARSVGQADRIAVNSPPPSAPLVPEAPTAAPVTPPAPAIVADPATSPAEGKTP